jgi:asparagine synthase (glutamine-hydrolysing)
MSTTDGRFTIVYNGEIFNYKELKDLLTDSERESLRSQSDTEILLLLYSRMGSNVFPLLRGFFAAAIYDHQESSLMMVRDRYGKKPLLYFLDKDRLCFASEMKALLAMEIPKVINWDVLPVYLQLNYIPQPFSIIANVQKLPAGHFMRINTSGIDLKCYYKLETYPEKYAELSYEQAQHKLVDIMDEAVRLRLVSDVPLGAFLSGGIDSSVVVALASKHVRNLNTFSIGYKDNPFFDETKYAKLVANKYKTNHTVFSLTNNDFLEHIHDVLKYIDEPFADSSAIPQYILSYHTRKHVTVALSGDGGDEIFAGYNKHKAEWRMRNGGVLNTLVKTAHPLLSILPKSRHTKVTNKVRQLHRFATGTRLNVADRYWKWASLNSEKQALNLLSSRVKNQIDGDDIAALQSSFTSGIKGYDFNEVLLADMNLVLPGDMLVKVDLMSMANSLEIRSPFLDQEVVEFAFGLPSDYKINAGMKKRVVQDAFRTFLPAELYNRPKQGFDIPLLGWFRNELWSLIDEDLLSDNFILEQQIFDLSAVQNLKKKLLSPNPEDSHETIWALVVFQYWWKSYIL